MIELLVVVGLVALVVGMSVRLLNPKTAGLSDAGEQLVGLVEQARILAISKRKPVALVIGTPDVLGYEDDVLRVGLFELSEWSDGEEHVARQIQNWHPLPEGVMLFEGEGEQNLLDAPTVSLRWRGGSESAAMHGMVVSPRGKLLSPPGSGTFEMVLGRGYEKAGESVRTSKDGDLTILVGRATARAWVMD